MQRTCAIDCLTPVLKLEKIPNKLSPIGIEPKPIMGAEYGMLQICFLISQVVSMYDY